MLKFTSTHGVLDIRTRIKSRCAALPPHPATVPSSTPIEPPHKPLSPVPRRKLHRNQQEACGARRRARHKCSEESMIRSLRRRRGGSPACRHGARLLLNLGSLPSDDDLRRAMRLPRAFERARRARGARVPGRGARPGRVREQPCVVRAGLRARTAGRRAWYAGSTRGAREHLEQRYLSS